MNDLETTVTQKGQVTIPQEVRKAMGLKPHDRVRFAVEGDRVTIRRAESAILAGFGSVTPSRHPEDFRVVRGAVERAIAEDVAGETAHQR